jgi:hypothetical protein
MELLPTEAGVTLDALARAARHHGTGGRAEYRLEVDGQMRHYAAEATPQPAAPGEPSPGTALLVRDITEQHALETELYRLASFPLLHPEPMLELGICSWRARTTRWWWPRWRGSSAPCPQAHRRWCRSAPSTGS